MKSKKTKSTPKSNHQPICVMASAIPDRKMAAIERTAEAVLEVAKALNSVNVQATISNCVISDAEVGIKING